MLGFSKEIDWYHHHQQFLKFKENNENDMADFDGAAIPPPIFSMIEANQNHLATLFFEFPSTLKKWHHSASCSIVEPWARLLSWAIMLSMHSTTLLLYTAVSASLPHWTKFSNFIQKWLKKTVITFLYNITSYEMSQSVTDNKQRQNGYFLNTGRWPNNAEYPFLYSLWLGFCLNCNF